MRKPEIMSPAGYWPQLRAAIEAGADAVYFGLRHFTARAKVGFEVSELPEAMATLHRRGVRGYVTFNTLVFEHEIGEAARALESIARAGADAIIVQDLGIARLAREIAPDLEIHASTQMSVTNAEGVRLAQRLGAAQGYAGARAFAGRDPRHPRDDRLRAGDFRARRAVRGLFRPVLFVGGLGRAQRQSRPVRAGLPLALRNDGGWQARAARRCPLSAFARRSVRPAADSRNCRDRRCRAQDRRPLQGCRLRGAGHARLSPGRGRRRGWNGAADRPRRRTGAGTGLFARPRCVLFERHESSGGGERARAAPSRRTAGQGRPGGGFGHPDRAGRSAPGGAAQAGRWGGVRRRRLAQSGGERRRRARLRSAPRGHGIGGALRQRRDRPEPHPPRRLALAHPRSGHRQGRPALSGRRAAVAQAAGKGAGRGTRGRTARAPNGASARCG